MGGPIYTILKGISCLLVAKAAGAIPIFWLATEDHDVAEIDHTYLVDTLGNLQRFHLSMPKNGIPVEDLILTEKNIEVIKTYLATVNLPQESWPEITNSYSRTMAQVMVRLFAGTGMVFLEPKLLRPLAVPFFKREIEENCRIQEILKATTQKLVEQGGKAVIPFTEGTNLFYKNSEGQRCKVKFDETGFVVGKERFSEQELFSIIVGQPERMSANVAARPVLQSLLIPTIAYIAGPSEMEYFAQLGDYHLFHGVKMPLILPHISASLVPPYADNLLQKCKLQPWDEIPHHWPTLMPWLAEGKESLETEWFASASKEFHLDLSHDTLMSFTRSMSRKLMHKVCKARLHRSKIPSHGLHLLRNLLHPHDKPQERVLNWLGFQRHSEENLVMECLQQISWDANNHLYFYL